MTIGENIKKLRKSNKMSSQELADIVGITRAQISKIETNASNPSVDVLKKIAKALNCTVSEIIGEGECVVSPEVKALVEASNKLSSEQLELLTKFINSMK